MKRFSDRKLLLTAIAAVAVIALLSVTVKYIKTEKAGRAMFASDRCTPPHSQECNGIYYWKTVLKLDSAERDFLRRNDVRRAYVRFFDVVADTSPFALESLKPNATLLVVDSIPVPQIVPVVYITDEAIRRMKDRESHWAEMIVNRVRNMSTYNGFGLPSEIQLDCDWTQSTDSIFFRLCRYVKNEMLQIKDEALVSSTIRLHQLSQQTPPVDYGVLMLYNTGDFSDADTENSIISADDVRPYMEYLAHYPLHLDLAYPAYKWNLLFRRGKFVGILRDTLPDGITAKCGLNKVRLIHDTTLGDTRLLADDVVRQEWASPEAVDKVNRLVEKEMKGRIHSNILYHLDSKILNDEIFKQ